MRAALIFRRRERGNFVDAPVGGWARVGLQRSFRNPTVDASPVKTTRRGRRPRRRPGANRFALTKSAPSSEAR